MVSCVVINYNGLKFLKTCLDSLASLKFDDKEIVFIDNASTDSSVDFVRKHYPKVRVVANTINSGYAGAADQAVRITKGEWLMLLNPDIVFEHDYLTKIMKRAESDTKIGAIIGKLRRFDFDAMTKTNILDSAGLEMYKNRRCVDRGQGEEDRGQYDTAEEVFGITGAAPLYRRAALESSKIDGEYFDTDFFMYKEDVDISWRLRLFGWSCFYDPAALGYHVRGTGVYDRRSIWGVAKNRDVLGFFQKFHSYKNERWMRIKNDFGSLVTRHVGHIVAKEILMLGWMTLREPAVWKAVFAFLKDVPKMMKKRREIMRRKKVGAREMGRWFV